MTIHNDKVFSNCQHSITQNMSIVAQVLTNPMRESINFLSNTIRRSWKTALLIAIVAVATIAVSA